MPKSILLILLFIPFIAFADTFTVTSNADSGPGTLRAALQAAGDNGASIQDTVVFNIADSSETGRTIKLLSTLPYLTSNLIIDGTTQPGPAFGKSNAKVRLTLFDFPEYVFSFLYMYATASSNIEIDGIFFYQPYLNINSGVEFQAIHFDGCTNMQIGRPGKGNYFVGFTETITNNSYSINDQYDYPISVCNNITIQGNVEGLNLDGFTTKSIYGGTIYYAANSINLENTGNILIGGADSSSGNYIASSVSINIQSFTGNTGSFVKILNNKLGANVNDTSYLMGGSSVVQSNIFLRQLTGTVDIEQNTLTGQLTLANLSQYFYVKSNMIYNPDYSPEVADKILVSGTAGGMIGGDSANDGNKLFDINALGYNAISSNDNSVSILNNSIYCNQKLGSSVQPSVANDISNYAVPGRTFPWVIIDATVPGTVNGRAKPNCRIDVYQDDECPACEGKQYLGTTQSNATGTWVYSGNFSGVVVATATDSIGTTFAFTNPFIDDDSIVIKQPTCGKNNGSVTGLQLVGGDNCEWHKVYTLNGVQYDVLFSKTLNASGFGPGTYVLHPKLGGTCNGIAKTYSFYEVFPLLDSSQVQLSQPYCGKNNGSITGMSGTGLQYSRLVWRNAGGTRVGGDSLNISNIGSGEYTLYAIDTTGGGCMVSAGPFALVNQPGPSINTQAIQITNASCSRANGAIQNISYQNATGSLYFAWVDSAGNIVGDSLALTNVPAGEYFLKLKDGGRCDTVTTAAYDILNKGVIAYDTSLLQTKDASCKGPDGNIAGITSTNASVFSWINTATGDTIGTAENVGGLQPGTYQLMFNNAWGCMAQTNAITIAQATFLYDSVIDATLTNASCNTNNGSVDINQFTTSTSLYTFQWLDTAGNILSSSTTVDNLAAGTYTLSATDNNSCKQIIYTANIIQEGSPQFDYSQVQLAPDTCNTGQGFIDSLLVTGSSATYAWVWYDSLHQKIAATADSLMHLKAGSYYASVTDANNCTVNSNLFTINDYEFVPPAPQAPGVSVPASTAAYIQVTNALNGTYNLYDTVDAVMPINTSTNGTLTTPLIFYDKLFYVQYVKGDCSSPLQPVMVKVLDSAIISIPNAFSPNGDGINDYWHMQPHVAINEFNMKVFNRYGQQVFICHDVNSQWDGTLNGKPLPVGTYYYIIMGTYNYDRPIKLSGYVVLLR